MALDGSYITVEEADAYAAAELDASAWDALSAAQKAAALCQATDEIDAVRWQGRVYDEDQERAFPRIAGELPSDDADGALATAIWDYDDDAGEAVVPEAVKRATALQAMSLAAGVREARLDDRHDGVTGTSAGGVSETYDAGRPAEILCRRAWQLLRRYRLRSGKIV